jgi:hypothetical protein
MRLGFLVIISFTNSFTKRVPSKRTFFDWKQNLLILICIAVSNTDTLTDIRNLTCLK